MFTIIPAEQIVVGSSVMFPKGTLAWRIARIEGDVLTLHNTLSGRKGRTRSMTLGEVADRRGFFLA